MDMVERYLQSKAARPMEAKQIPSNPVNFFDQNSEFQENFTPNEQATSNDDTTFTTKALAYLATQRQKIVIPESFVPLEQGVSLNRWTQDNTYYAPGLPGREGKN